MAEETTPQSPEERNQAKIDKPVDDVGPDTIAEEPCCKSESPEERETRRAGTQIAERINQRSQVARMVAAAVCQNPQVERLLAGKSPTDPGATISGVPVGKHLAKVCWHLAGDFVDELHELSTKTVAEAAEEAGIGLANIEDGIYF